MRRAFVLRIKIQARMQNFTLIFFGGGGADREAIRNSGLILKCYVNYVIKNEYNVICKSICNCISLNIIT